MVTNQLKKVLQNSLKYNSPFTCIENTAKVMNEVEGSRYQIPTTMHKIQNVFKSAFDYELHYECLKCNTYTSVHYNAKKTDKLKCGKCGIDIKRSTDNFFIYIPLAPQLEVSIKRHWDSIMLHLSQTHHKEIISDVNDGQNCKKMYAKYPDSVNLSFVLNTDGAQVFKSTRKSLWPVQLYQNFLPPQMRFIPKNIIVVALYFGEKNRTLENFFFRF